jgi:hypothetical protein
MFLISACRKSAHVAQFGETIQRPKSGVNQTVWKPSFQILKRHLKIGPPGVMKDSGADASRTVDVPARGIFKRQRRINR